MNIDKRAQNWLFVDTSVVCSVYDYIEEGRDSEGGTTTNTDTTSLFDVKHFEHGVIEWS